MKEVVHTLLEAFILVVLVVFLFLGNVRATLIPMIAVPVSLIGTFAVLLAMGFSANTISMFAMILAIGIVVDDAIVVVESVEHKLEETTLSVPDAVKEAMKEITAPIIAITLVLLSVFVPVGFIPGITGQLYQQFAVTVSVAMLLSAINALTLSPALCALLLKRGTGHRGIMGRVSQCHRHRARRLWPHRRRSGAAKRFSGSCSSDSLRSRPTTSMPRPRRLPARGGSRRILHRAAAAGRLDGGRTTRAAEKVENIVRDLAGVEDVTTAIGFSLLNGLAQSNSAFMVVPAQAL